MIDYEKEAAKLVQGWVLNDMNDPHAREALEGRIAALCRRVDEEARAARSGKKRAKVCDEIALQQTVISGFGVKAANECAAAIRTRKEENEK